MSPFRRLHRRGFVALAVVLAAWRVVPRMLAEENKPDTGLPNVETPTFGGLQYWADELICHDYRIQRNASTGHYRLLDGKDERLAWGTFDQCRAKLDQVKRDEKLKPLPKRVVLTLHG